MPFYRFLQFSFFKVKNVILFSFGFKWNLLSSPQVEVQDHRNAQLLELFLSHDPPTDPMAFAADAHDGNSAGFGVDTVLPLHSVADVQKVVCPEVRESPCAPEMRARKRAQRERKERQLFVSAVCFKDFLFLFVSFRFFFPIVFLKLDLADPDLGQPPSVLAAAAVAACGGSLGAEAVAAARSMLRGLAPNQVAELEACFPPSDAAFAALWVSEDDAVLAQLPEAFHHLTPAMVGGS
jgi:hypothetical protein